MRKFFAVVMSYCSVPPLVLIAAVVLTLIVARSTTTAINNDGLRAELRKEREKVMELERRMRSITIYAEAILDRSSPPEPKPVPTEPTLGPSGGPMQEVVPAVLFPPSPHNAGRANVL